MSDISEIRDEHIRGRLEEAWRLMRDGQPAPAVHACVEAFIRLAELQPDEVAPLASATSVRDAPQTLHWPDYGTRLMEDPEGGPIPRVIFERERFSLSEAITYLEFVTSRAVALGA